jgi:hypothetical protein
MKSPCVSARREPLLKQQLLLRASDMFRHSPHTCGIITQHHAHLIETPIVQQTTDYGDKDSRITLVSRYVYRVMLGSF